MVLDAVLSFLSLVAFATFLGVIAWFVREPDLIIIMAGGFLAAAYDFWRSFQASQRNGGQS